MYHVTPDFPHTCRLRQPVAGSNFQRIEHHQMMQQQEMLHSITSQQQTTTLQQQAIQGIEAKLAKQEEIQNQVLQQQEQLRQMTLQQTNKQIEIHNEVAHLHNKQDQLA